MSDDTRAFREYATRVSFNITVSRNQVATLRQIALDCEQYQCGLSWDERLDSRPEHVPMFIPGCRHLVAHGLVRRALAVLEDEARIAALKASGKYAVRKYTGPAHEPTDAGWHLVALLRIAGLIPTAIANQNRKGVRRVA